MTHYILLKLNPLYKTDDVYGKIKKTYAELGDIMDGVGPVTIYRNCVKRSTNADFLIRMEVRDEEALKAYLSHNVHKEFAVYMDQRIVQRTTFDSVE